MNLTHWSRVTHVCVGKLTIIGSDNGLSPERRQAIIWTYAGILLIGPLGTNFSKILIEIQTFSLKKIRLKMSSAICCSFCPGLNVLNLGTMPNWYLHEHRRKDIYLSVSGITGSPLDKIVSLAKHTSQYFHSESRCHALWISPKAVPRMVW